MRRGVAILAAVAFACALGAPGAAAKGPAHHADGKLGDWRGTPTYLAGHSTTSRGEFIYTDYLYDDYGPDLNNRTDMPAFRSALAPTRGDYRYPDDAKYGHNAADLRELRIAADRKAIHLLIGLETMKVRDAAIVQIALDLDHTDRTSAPSGSWPDGAGITTRGPATFVTAWGRGARLTVYGKRKHTRSLRTAVNLAQNAIEVDVPRSAVGRVAKTSRVWVVTGLNDGHGRFREQTSGATAVFDTGFQTEHYAKVVGSGWNDDDQSAALAQGSIPKFFGTFSLSRLVHRASDPRRAPRPGRYTRLFKSRLGFGEGIALKNPGASPEVGGSPDPEFKSPWQEYALYIPRGYDPKHRNVLTLDGHSLDDSYLEYYTISPNQQVQLGDERKSVIITPLARGVDTWYIRSGLADTMEAWNDVRRRYRVDDDRTFITGYSMGGFMTYRLGLLMPDRFVKASVYVGPPAYQLWPYPASIQPGGRDSEIGDTNLIVDNARDLPYEINHGNADELVPVEGVQHQVDTFQAAGNAYAFYRHSANDHLAFIINDQWAHTRDFLGTGRINRRPREVVYKRYPAMDLPQFGMRFDRAYWVSGIGVRGSQSDTSNSGEVRATTLALGGHRIATVQDTPQPVTGPVSPGLKFQQRQVPGAAIQRANAFEVKLTNISAATFDLATMGITTSRAITIHFNGDGFSEVRLIGRFTNATSTGATMRRIRGGVSLGVPGGKHDVVVTPT